MLRVVGGHSVNTNDIVLLLLVLCVVCYMLYAVCCMLYVVCIVCVRVHVYMYVYSSMETASFRRFLRFTLSFFTISTFTN